MGITREAGAWPPRFISAVGNLLTGLEANSHLVEFALGKGGGIRRVHTLGLLAHQKFLRVGPYTALDASTGVSVLPVPTAHSSRVTYELARISLNNGAITEAIPLEASAYRLFTWRNKIYLLTESGEFTIYTRNLRRIGSHSRVAGWLSNFAVSPSK